MWLILTCHFIINLLGYCITFFHGLFSFLYNRIKSRVTLFSTFFFLDDKDLVKLGLLRLEINIYGSACLLDSQHVFHDDALGYKHGNGVLFKWFRLDLKKLLKLVFQVQSEVFARLKKWIWLLLDYRLWLGLMNFSDEQFLCANKHQMHVDRKV